MILIEGGLLNFIHDVSVLTNNLGQSSLSDLSQLRLCEPHGSIGGFVPESVTLLGLLELNTDDAGKCGSNQSSFQRNLTQTSRKEVDVFNGEVDLFQPFYHILAKRKY